MEQGKEQHDQCMRLIREQCERGERSDEEAVSSSSWKEHNEVQDDCNIQEKRLDEATETHWELYNSDVDESTSTDVDCHDHENEVNKEEDVEQNLTYPVFVRIERIVSR